MSVSRRVLARHIATALAGGTDRNVVLKQLAAYLIVHKQLGQLELVIADIVRAIAELGTVKATVTVAHPLTAELRTAVERFVTQLEHASTVQLEERIDPHLLGGIVIETPHKRYDAAVAAQLTRLRNDW